MPFRTTFSDVAKYSMTPSTRSLSALAELLACTCGWNNWESVEDRWVHAARIWQALN